LALLLDSQDNEATQSEGKKNDIDDVFDATGFEPKAKDKVHGWEELREQIKEDLRKGHRAHKPLSQMNQLTILRNFATLHIKGLQHMAASEEIVQQWHNRVGIHFA